MVVLWLSCGLFYGLIRGCFGTPFVVVLWLFCGMFDGLTEDFLCPISWLFCDMFDGIIEDYFVLCFMAALWTILWPNWGLFWDPFYGWFMA